MTAAGRIADLARRYRRRRGLVVGLLCAGAALMGIATAWRSGATVPLSIGIGIAGVVIAAIIAHGLLGPVPDAVFARHLDRTVPEAEESAELVLRDDDLTLVEQLQRRRVEAALERAEFPEAPDRVARRVAASGIAALIGAAAITLFPGTPARGITERPAERKLADAPARLTGASVEIRPPRYTGNPIRRQEGLEIDAEEGAEIEWTLRTNGHAIAPRIATSAGDTTSLAPSDTGEANQPASSEYRTRFTARRSLLYSILLDSAAGSSAAAEIHRLTVRLDAAPEVTVLRPAPRSELPPGAALRLPVEVLATDDHGTAAADLVATVTSGSGESVRFREQRLPFPAPRAARGGALFRMELDLAALGMAPGDELYFHVVARDRRPEPNVGRSATVFVSLADTAAQQPPLVAGISLPVAPEYFRSQRQIIIDTERLIADAPRLPTDIFRERANAIGIDQGLLRLRYGEFTGEEFQGEVEAGETHDHDSEENATLLADSVKATLKGAIAEMWEAELRLRTYRPKEALPYEFRALELLKIVQQSSRAYVQRVGFEPPPLEIDRRRLTGDLDGVRSRSVNDSAGVEDPRRASREALALLRELQRGVAASSADRASLAAAEDELARLAVGGEGAHLLALRRLRRLRASLRDGNPCDGCVPAADSALVASLPSPPASAPPRAPGNALARRYAEILGASGE